MNYYEVLELREKCLKEEIRKNYHRLSLKYHPDKNKGLDTSEKFKEISEAYTILYDDESRLVYDIQLFFKDIDITINDTELLISYYNKIINSKEYKLFQQLYQSIPKKAKDELWKKFRNRNSKLVVAKRSINILELEEDETINLIMNDSDYTNNILKIIYIFAKTGNYYLYLRKPPKRIIIPNINCNLSINFFIHTN